MYLYFLLYLLTALMDSSHWGDFGRSLLVVVSPRLSEFTLFLWPIKTL